MTLEIPEQAADSEPSQPKRRREKGWWKLPVIVGAAGLVLGAGIAASITIPSIVISQDDVTYFMAKAQSLDGEVTTLKEQKAAVDKQLLAERKTIGDREGKVAEREQKVSSAEKTVADREATVSAKEKQIAANSFTGGVRLVGTNTTPGVYATGNITSGMCYYAWKTGTESGAGIVDNNIVKSGTATVTLRDGEVFESSGCGTWTKQG